jgi:hypothetical protein
MEERTQRVNSEEPHEGRRWDEADHYAEEERRKIISTPKRRNEDNDIPEWTR